MKNWLKELINYVDHIEGSLQAVDESKGYGALLHQLRKEILGIDTGDDDAPPYAYVFDLAELLKRAQELAAQEGQKGSDRGSELTKVLSELVIHSARHQPGLETEESTKESLEHLKKEGGMAFHASAYCPEATTSKGALETPTPERKDAASPREAMLSPSTDPDSHGINADRQDVDIDDAQHPRETLDTSLLERFAGGQSITQAEAHAFGLRPIETKFVTELELMDQAQSGPLPDGVLAMTKTIALTFADVVNTEGQVYTSSLWQKQIPRLKALAQQNRLLGNLDHPEAGKSKLQGAAIRWLADSLNLVQSSGTLYARGYVMETSAGKDLCALKQNKIPVEISSRAFGREHPGKWQGQDVMMIDEDAFVCTAFDVVYHGASADGERRPRLDLVQGAGEPAPAHVEVLEVDRLKVLRERFEKLQERARVDELLEQLAALEGADEPAADALDQLEKAAALLEAALPETGGDVEEQAYVDARVSVDPQGVVNLRMPREVLMTTAHNPYGNAPANDEDGQKPQAIPDNVQVYGATHPVDASEAQAQRRMARYQEADPKIAALMQEVLASKVEKALTAETNPQMRKYLEKRLTKVTEIGDFDEALTQAKDDFTDLFGEVSTPTSEIPRSDMANWGMPYFQRGAKDPAEAPARTGPEAIDKLVQGVSQKFKALHQINSNFGEGETDYDDVPEPHEAGPGFPSGQRNAEDTLRGYLQEFCLSDKAAGRRALQYHMALEQARYLESKVMWDDVMDKMGNDAGLIAMMQALGTGAMSTSEVAAGQAHLLKIITATWPKLIVPYIGAIQPTNKPTATVYFERFKGTSGGTPTILTSAADSGATPLVRLDQIAYTPWTTGVYSEDPGEGADASVVQYSIDSSTVDITAKKLRAEWSLESEQDLLSYHALDAASQYVGFMADQIAREINDEILDACWTAVPTAHQSSFSITQPSGYGSQATWDTKIYTSVNAISNQVYIDRNAECNILVAAPNVAQRLAQTNPHGTQALGFMAPLVEGLAQMERMVESYLVFKYARWGTMSTHRNTALALYRGRKWSSVGVVWTPYTFEITPLDTTPASFKRQIGCMDRSGYSVVEPNNFGRLTVAAGTATSHDLIGTS